MAIKSWPHLVHEKIGPEKMLSNLTNSTPKDLDEALGHFMEDPLVSSYL